eukprot:3650333-Pyramimonas_sp.AAC.1
MDTTDPAPPMLFCALRMLTTVLWNGGCLSLDYCRVAHAPRPRVSFWAGAQLSQVHCSDMWEE